MRIIEINDHQWEIDESRPLGKAGGFGAVYEGRSVSGIKIAVKRLHLSADVATHRELRLAEFLMGRDLTHVLPIMDAGQDKREGRYYVVMARADRSLQDEIDLRGACSADVTRAIAHQILLGLDEVPSVVHRDIKPPNILMHEGCWKIADFGIARFVEYSTSLNTLKACLSPQYGAPEQWKLERATHATDIYALGCIIYTLLTGNPPFNGTSSEELRQQHLYGIPPSLRHLDQTLDTLAALMLSKSPEARPTRSRLAKLLIRPEDGTKPTWESTELQQAGSEEAKREVQADIDRMKVEGRHRNRESMAKAGRDSFRRLVESIRFCVEQQAPTAVIDAGLPGIPLQVTLGHSSFEIRHLHMDDSLPVDSFALSGWDVLLGAVIRVRQTKPIEVARSANLWFMAEGTGEDYRWVEVSYYAPLSSGVGGKGERPFSLTVVSDADKAAAEVLATYAHAYGPVCVDAEDCDKFCKRWADWIGAAALGKLVAPVGFPWQTRELFI